MIQKGTTMKKLAFPIAIVLIAALLSGCGGFQIVNGSGDILTETRQVGEFNAITLQGSGEVFVTQGDQAALTIEGDDNLLPYLETEVHGDTLTIGLKDEYMVISLHPSEPIRFYVTVVDLSDLTVAGSGNIHAEAFQGEDFRIHVLGSGDIDIESLAATSLDVDIAGSGNASIDTLTADEITITVQGSGDFSTGGQATSQEILIQGSGDCNAADLQSQDATVRIMGSGSANLWVDGSLNVTIMGSGDVNYSGDAHMDVESMGSGDVNRVERH
jgi:hypothetical protein